MSRLRNIDTGALVSDRITRAVTPWQRTTGYLGRRSVSPAEGLWFDQCAAVHTFGLRALIDIVFVDGNGRIVRSFPNAGRNRIFRGGRDAVAAIELGAGATQAASLTAGDRLALE